MTRKHLNNQNGSITVEAAIIVPLVIIAVMIVLYIALIIFQIGIMQIAVNNATERAAAIWQKGSADFETNKINKADIERLGLYRRLSNGSPLNEEELRTAAINTLQDASLLKGKNIEAAITHQNLILTQKITIELSAYYSNPLGGLTEIWGLSRDIHLKVQSQAVIDDPAEFIRNSDFILETASEIPLISEFEGNWNEIINKIVEYINSLNKERKQNVG